MVWALGICLSPLVCRMGFRSLTFSLFIRFWPLAITIGCLLELADQVATFEARPNLSRRSFRWLRRSRAGSSRGSQPTSGRPGTGGGGLRGHFLAQDRLGFESGSPERACALAYPGIPFGTTSGDRMLLSPNSPRAVKYSACRSSLIRLYRIMIALELFYRVVGTPRQVRVINFTSSSRGW